MNKEKDKKQLIKEIIMLQKRVDELESNVYCEYMRTQNNNSSSENRYRSIIDNIEEAYFELDLRGNIVFFNKAMPKMLGYSPKELMGMNYRKYVHPKTATRLFKIFNNIYRTRKPTDMFENEIIRKDGSRRFREMSVSLIIDSQDQPIGYRCLARDITKRKLTEEALEKKDKELEFKSRSLEESNTAMKVLLEQREKDKIELEKNILSNVNKIIIPYINRLKKTKLSPDQMVCVETIENNLINIISPFLRNIVSNYHRLTPKEMDVANLIKEGKTSKEIANFLEVSIAAIDFHRNNIRKKLGLNNRKINLRSYLLSLS